MKKTTITEARVNLPALWDKIERSKRAVILTRRGHEDMALLPAAELRRLQDAVLGRVLALLGTDIEQHQERIQGFPVGLLARMKALTADVPINHDEEIERTVLLTQEWHLSVAEQVELLRILAAPSVVTPALAQATTEAKRLFGVQGEDNPPT